MQTRELVAVLSLLALAAGCKETPPPALGGEHDTSAPSANDATADGAAADAAMGAEPSTNASGAGAPGSPDTFGAALPASDGGSGTVLTLHDSGKSVDLLVGASLTVELKSTPGTGFSWDLVKTDAKVLTEQGGTAAPAGDASDLPGGHKPQTFVFVGKAPGKAHVELAYHRPWDKDGKPAKTFSIDVTVKQP